MNGINTFLIIYGAGRNNGVGDGDEFESPIRLDFYDSCV